MPTSDSEDFESADEGHSSIDKKERKSRLSSSNYSDQTAESDAEPKNRPDQKPCSSDKSKPDTLKSNDGWDDFDIDDDTDPEPTQSKVVQQPAGSKGQKKEENVTSVSENTHDTGWDDFDDWGQGDSTTTLKAPTESSTEDKIKDVTDRLAAASTGGNGGWGWGWGVDSLLSTATAGITTLTSQVSQGISTVLETSIGAPDPEELARQKKENDTKKSGETEEKLSEEVPKPPNTSDAQFPFGNLLSGVTKFVETTGTKVIAGGLDTLETIGKKTMEVLQDGDPGLTKKRAMLGLDHGDKPVLSQVLREAKTKADEEDRIREQKREAKEVHYETLFDDFEGLVHLEALEMLSRQISMRIEERMRGIDADKRLEIKETLQQVAELCEMPEEEEEEDEQIEGAKHEALLERLQAATQDVGIKIQFQPLVKQYKEVLTWLSTEATDRQTYKQAVSSLAQCTALTVEIYHKMAEMLIVKPRRSTADEADAVTQMTVVLTKHVSELATLFTEKLNSLHSENKEQINTYITNIFLEAGNSSTYIQNAFQLTLPILQIGAV